MSTGILIWIAVGLVGFSAGLAAVAVARHKSSQEVVPTGGEADWQQSAPPTAAPAEAQVRETQPA